MAGPKGVVQPGDRQPRAHYGARLQEVRVGTVAQAQPQRADRHALERQRAAVGVHVGELGEEVGVRAVARKGQIQIRTPGDRQVSRQRLGVEDQMVRPAVEETPVESRVAPRVHRGQVAAGRSGS